ncbi:MAG: glycosyltransferase, partial [Gemmatimonadaceae bacterium]
LGSFWEKLVQPQVFAIMLARYGGTEVVNESPRASDKIANGQCIFVERNAYVAIGGHGAVRDKVAEDLALAQLYFTTGRRACLVLGLDQLSTRMYTSLRQLVEGWGKNIYASGRDTVPFGRVGRFLFPVLLLVPALTGVVPPVLVGLSLLGVFGPSVLLWASLVTATNTAWWLLCYAFLGMSPLWALLHPVGAAALLYISVRAVVRGRRVRWKERDYVVT